MRFQCLRFQALLKTYENAIEELNRNQKSLIEKAEQSQAVESKAFTRKLKVEQVCNLLVEFIQFPFLELCNIADLVSCVLGCPLVYSVRDTNMYVCPLVYSVRGY